MTTNYPGRYYPVYPILRRDGYLCQICKKENDINKLIVHHKDRNRKHNTPNNLITLCRSCHGKEHLSYRKGSWDKDRDDIVTELRDMGKTFREISEIMGFSRQRAQQIYNRSVSI